MPNQQRNAQNAQLLQQRLDVCMYTTQDDFERSKEKARELAQSIFPTDEWKNFEEKGIVCITGKRGSYIISPYSQTEIRDLQSGQCTAYACMQLTVPAPTCDRMIAEYLLIKNAEDVYWKTANIFQRSASEFSFLVFFLALFDFALFTSFIFKMLWIR